MQYRTGYDFRGIAKGAMHHIWRYNYWRDLSEHRVWMMDLSMYQYVYRIGSSVYSSLHQFTGNNIKPAMPTFSFIY